jgi:hypothetical protein
MRRCRDIKRSAVFLVSVTAWLGAAGMDHPQVISVAEANTSHAEKPLTSAMCGETGEISAAEPALRLVCVKRGVLPDAIALRGAVIIGQVDLVSEARDRTFCYGQKRAITGAHDSNCSSMGQDPQG